MTQAVAPVLLPELGKADTRAQIADGHFRRSSRAWKGRHALGKNTSETAARVIAELKDAGLLEESHHEMRFDPEQIARVMQSMHAA